MFERYTELARRTIFFARYEASQFGAPYIETEHLLLGLLREDRALRGRLPLGSTERIRKQIEESVPRPAAPTPTSADLPLSQECRRVLLYAGEESEALRHIAIDCGHLLLGILRVETSAGARLLREIGIEYAGYRAMLEGEHTPAAPEDAPAGPLASVVADLRLQLNALTRLEEDGGQRLKRSGWTRKEAIGHLIDWAAAHQQWFARALTSPALAASGYPADGWLAAQQYNAAPWADLVGLCILLNRMICHVLARIPEEKLETPCRVGVAAPVPLQELAHRYVAHYDDIVGQLLMRG